MSQYLLVRGIAQCYMVEVVRLHELVEDIGTEHHRLRYHHLGILKLVELGMPLHDVVKECQTTALASKRAVANARKVAV